MIISKTNLLKIDIETKLIERIKSNKLQETLIVVPTNRKARNYKRQIVASCNSGVSSKIYLETITTLTQKILEPSLNFHLMSDAAASVLIKQSIDDVVLKYFNIYKSKVPYGTLDRIKNVISKLKEHGISASEIKSEAIKNLSGSNIDKANDLANIYSVYKSKCRRIKYYEIGDVYEEVLFLEDKKFESNFNKIFKGITEVFILGFDEFTVPEGKIIDRIASLAEVEVFIDFDYYDYNDLIFKHLDSCKTMFLSMGFSEIDDISITAKNDFKDSIRKYLFKGKKEPKIDLYKQRIIKIKTTSRLKEIEYIAKEIKYLISEKKVSPHKICLSFNLIQNYSSIIRNVFSKYKIPYNLTDRFSLDNSPLIIFLVNLLNIEQNDYYYKDLFKVLNNRFIQECLGDCESVIKVAGELKITIGKENWINTIKGKIEQKYGIDEEDEDKNKEIYIDALEKFNKIIEMLEPFSKNCSIEEFISNFKKLVNELNITSKIITNNIVVDQKNIKALTTFWETINEVFNLLRKEYGSSAAFNLAFFLENIKTACKWARYNIKEVSDYGVLITTINEIRGLKFDYLFVSGMVDGDFPTKYNPEIFDQNKFLRKDYLHQTEERYHFYQTLQCWNKCLYLTAPELEGESELEESIFFSDIENMFEITIIDVDSSEQIFKNRLFSNEELFSLYGALLKNDDTEKTEEIKQKYKTINFDNIDKYNEIKRIRSFNYLEKNPYNGFIIDENADNTENVKQLLENNVKKQFSITQLEEYAKCPYRYYLNRVIKIDSLKEPSDEVESFEIGNLLHSILFEFFQYLKEQNINISECSNSEYIKIQKYLFQSAEQIISESNLIFPISFFEKEKILGVEGDKNNSILMKFIESERNIEETFSPEFFEVKFGFIKDEFYDKDLYSEQPIEIGGIKLRGKIDRIDIDKENLIFNIIDYKSGKTKPKIDDIKNGISLQLPVYMIAAKKMLEDISGVEYHPAFMYLYKLRYSNKEFKKDLIKVAKGSQLSEIIEENKELFELTEENIKNEIESMKNGVYHLSKLPDRKNKVCSFCDFGSICRINELKI